MATIRVSLIGELYDCVKPLFEQTVRAEGVELVVTRSPSPEAMRRQLTAWEFDICEMAFGAYLIARAQGADVTAIPVFPRRCILPHEFRMSCGRPDRWPARPRQQAIGVAEYVQSATLWARGILEHDFGLDPGKAQWYVERAGSGSTGEVLGFKPPPRVSPCSRRPEARASSRCWARTSWTWHWSAETLRRKPAMPCIPSSPMPSPKASAFTCARLCACEPYLHGSRQSRPRAAGARRESLSGVQGIEEVRSAVAASAKRQRGPPVRKRTACEDVRIVRRRSLCLWHRVESHDAGDRRSSYVRSRDSSATSHRSSNCSCPGSSDKVSGVHEMPTDLEIRHAVLRGVAFEPHLCAIPSSH